MNENESSKRWFNLEFSKVLVNIRSIIRKKVAIVVLVDVLNHLLDCRWLLRYLAFLSELVYKSCAPRNVVLLLVLLLFKG